ncbi:kunitz-type protease inhibitor 2 [Pempheris klunzingeri]|uniref:kunitz-type protease inhibitor 2 n=1 Tax=Pempheris klunzingeri TaxID=3127111 RepID=UPI00398161B1
MDRHRVSLLAVCVLLCAGAAVGCDWDPATDADQGLHPDSLDAGARYLNPAEQVSDPESCRAACCERPDCDVALVGYPADGGPQCLLVSCVVGDRDVCVLRPSSQFKAHRRRAEGVRGERPHDVPLRGPEEPETNNIRCRLPMKVGSCRAAFPRFYYDVTNHSCRSFIYGGCDANGNNFGSQEECEGVCSGVTGSVLPDESTPPPPPPPPVKAARMAPAFSTSVSQDAESPVESKPAATETVTNLEKGMSAESFSERCGAEPQVGPCRAAFQRWFYSRETGGCQSFIYGGCRGNQNNYNSQESCMAACTVSVLPSSKKAAAADDELSPEYRDQCTLTPDPGPCRAAFPMFFYDPKTSSCQSFMYGGCRGNHNRYGSMEECLTHCSRDGWFEGRGRTRNWTAAIFLFVTLASISALLLASLVFIVLRRHRLSRRPSSVSDKEELLPDPDEQLSVDSLTSPDSPKPDKA